MRKIKFIDKNNFFETALDKNVTVFVAHISNLAAIITIHSAIKAQIFFLFVKEVTIPAEYSDFAYFFLKKSAEILL